MVGAIGECIGLINDNDGFTIIAWYKRGSMNDKDLIASCNNDGSTKVHNTSYGNSNKEVTVQLGSGELSYHVVSINPTNRDFLDKNLKFDAFSVVHTAN